MMSTRAWMTRVCARGHCAVAERPNTEKVSRKHDGAKKKFKRDANVVRVEASARSRENDAPGSASETWGLEAWNAFKDDVRSYASTELGVTRVGVSSAHAHAHGSRIDRYKRWIEAGMHGEMAYLARADRVERREHLERVLPHVQSIISVGLWYWPGRSAFKPQQSELHGAVSCYAWGPDYHDILNGKLEALALYAHTKAGGGTGKYYVDTGAVLERDLAERAGLGFTGKNTMLIDRKHGSGFFLGEILSTLPIPPDESTQYLFPSRKNGSAETEHTSTETVKKKSPCGRCTLCQTKCPTNAFSEPYVLDARRCISYLTIELKGSIPEPLRGLMGNRIYGCDICQQVCPYNAFDWQPKEQKEASASPLFGQVRDEVTAPSLVSILKCRTDAEFEERFAGTAIKRIGRERLQRNACVAAGNITKMSRTQEMKESVEEVVSALSELAADDARPLVQEHAQWALNRLKDVAT
ncbi:Epoxyqueuosine reductase [Porphyridium purpureum]|uniref:Epoxyqueuosine reductase n=1 Tax=Porphyridium purpureum TaxID=35688 RepID=A0A5J4Z118_PORPP|nr:Epoxyqueuosine reductase [Porphyridium purpureum]|eukprot:POR1967..scf208_2